MTILHSRKQVFSAVKLAASTSLLGLSLSALAYDVPFNLSVDDDILLWQSSAPSTNIYEDGIYIATVHEVYSYMPVRDGATYQLVAHNYGVDFTPLSPPFVVPDDDGGSDGDDGIEYDEAKIYFELNDTDGDLGLHALVDGDSWRELNIEDPNDRSIFSVNVSNSLLAQGMTEIFFESSEPTFDELDPVDFFARFPAGEYDINGVTLEGEELESEAFLSHVIPSAPANTAVSGQLLPDSCEEVDGPVVAAPFNVVWDPVTHSHASLGIAGEVVVDLYQVVIEREEPAPLLISMDVSSEITSVQLPSEFFGSGENIKIEILTIADTGNQSAMESCFVSAN
ncbi:MAG: hypothetical protein KTR32_20175 [Granulosicoccus sp.]|nr:hypothetical protein [Granulosicoccus sp.]